jgi:cell division protein FtsA
MNEKEKLFALDIGTRSVVGIILEMDDNNKGYYVSDILTKEHSERAMLDGQIHDVMAVSKIISEIKEELEIKHGPLKKVNVAAAGRALKTERAKVTVDINGKPMMTKQDILHLELSAVQQAQASVAESHQVHKSHHYYCVGYSVLYYRLDNEEIGSLIDQQGSEASVEIIATFLPRVVVESLISALQRADLEMEALTLEPIAAINVLIPQTMRRLNVALVDIGAGTSDIAITDTGTVIAYGMVPVAGDEITEAISDQYLLDFPLAEKAKRELYNHSSITVTDILGFDTEIAKEEVIEALSPVLDRLSSSISEEILRLNNHKSPKAVMLVGGGSLTPEIPKKLAQKLNLPENRVAIRGIDAISSLSLADNITKGPELVTPIGIAIAAQKAPVQYRTVYVNNQPVRLFEVKKLTVGDCILASGIKVRELYGKPGMAMIISLNGTSITIPGEHGEGPTITKNGVIVSLDDPIDHNDSLVVVKGKDGRKTDIQISDLLDGIPQKTVFINGQKYTIHATITCNGLPATTEQLIQDRDKIECILPNTIEELCSLLGLQDELNELRPYRLNLNGKETFIPSLSGKVFRNGIEVRLSSTVDHLDEITIEKKRKLTVRELAEIKQIMLVQSIPISFNGKKISITKRITEFKRQSTLLKDHDIIFEGDQIIYEQKNIEPFIFQDVFKHVQINIPDKAKGQFILMKNEQQTTFNGKINAGDQLKIIWPI